MRRIALLVVLIVLLAGCGRVDRDDYAEVADGEQAGRDRVAAASDARKVTAFLRDALPWLSWRAESFSQRCEGMEVGFFGGTPMVRCMTAVTAYAGFDGELPDEIRRFDSTLTAAGWVSSGNPPPPGVIDYYAQFHGRAEGPRTYDASNLPPLEYRAGSDELATCGVRLSLTHEWLEAGQPLPPPDPAVPDGPDTVYRHDEPVDRDTVAAELLTTHRYVAILTTSVQCDYEVT